MKKILSIVLVMLLMISVLPTGLFSITASAGIVTSGTCGTANWIYNSDAKLLYIYGAGGNVTDSPWSEFGTEIETIYVEYDIAYICKDAFSSCTKVKNLSAPFYGTSKDAEKHEAVYGIWFGYDIVYCKHISEYNSIINGDLFFSYAIDFCATKRDSEDTRTVSKVMEWWPKYGDTTRVPGITTNDGVSVYGDDACEIFFRNKETTSEYKIDKSLFYYLSNTVCQYSGYEHSGNLYSSRNGLDDRYWNSYSLTSYFYYIPSTLTNVTLSTPVAVPDNVQKYKDEFGTYEYVVKGNGVEIVSCNIEKASIIIPSHIAGYAVVGIASNAFYGLIQLTDMIIPDSVTYIDEYAFNFCFNLTSIIIPNNVTNIDANAFYCAQIKDIYYKGSYEDRCEKLFIDSVNDPLLDATWHYNICPNQHSYSSSCDLTCNNCGWTSSAQDEHSFDNECDTECNLCEQIRKITHHYKSVWDKDALQHWYECSICEDKIEVTAHDFDNACDTECNVCKYVRTVPDHSYILNSNHTCDICKYSKTPVMPVVESKTNNSVTLVKTEGFEYSNDGTTWQDSNVFENLSADTTYTFYQRVKESEIAFASEASDGLSVTFKAAQTAPSAPIISSFTDTTVTLVPNANYEYSKDGTTWQTSNEFIGLSSGTKYTFYQRYAETDTHEASNKSSGTSITTDKSKQPLVPNAPTVQSFTSSSITLTPVDGCEYSKNGTTWQLSNVFGGLSCGTEYTFYQRYKETSTTYVGKSSLALVTKTDKGTQTAPAAPTLSSKTHNSVTLTLISGYEYSRDGINWQTSNIFTGLTPETNYMLYQRKAETDKYYASEGSSYLTVKTAEEPNYAEYDIAEIFPDTTNDGWYSDAVAYVYSQGMMKGYSDGTFGVSDGIQRQDFLVMLARFDGVDLTQYGYDCNMPDVARDSYYEAAVNWGVQNGITTGYMNGKFGVGDMITREQIVTFLYRYAKYKNIDVENVTNTKAKAFPDYNKVTDFAEAPIIWAIDKGVINGKSGYIAPQGNAQRCEIAQIMYNIFQKDIF